MHLTLVQVLALTPHTDSKAWVVKTTSIQLKKFQEKMQIAQVDRIENSEQRFTIFKLPFIGKASVDFKKDFCKLMSQKSKFDIKCV